jgi:hypothetical protein
MVTPGILLLDPRFFSIWPVRRRQLNTQRLITYLKFIYTLWPRHLSHLTSILVSNVRLSFNSNRNPVLHRLSLLVNFTSRKLDYESPSPKPIRDTRAHARTPYIPLANRNAESKLQPCARRPSGSGLSH